MVLNRLRRTKRRREPRFGVDCQPDYRQESGQWRLHHFTLTIHNQSDLPHRVDEALVRYDDGRVGLRLPLDVQLLENIPAHQSVSIQVEASSLLEPAGATRFRIVTYRGKHGQRREWSSKEEPFVLLGAPPAGS